MSKVKEPARLPNRADVQQVLNIMGCIDDMTMTEIILATHLPESVVENVLADLENKGKVFIYQNIRASLTTYSMKLKMAEAIVHAVPAPTP